MISLGQKGPARGEPHGAEAGGLVGGLAWLLVKVVATKMQLDTNVERIRLLRGPTVLKAFRRMRPSAKEHQIMSAFEGFVRDLG
jgi:hypothetical protein